MKTNCSFPHPVLGVNKGVLPDLEADALNIVSINQAGAYYEYTFELKYNNPIIERYITDPNVQVAEFICEVDCQKTLYKQVTASKTPVFTVKVKSTEVTDHIDFSFYIVACMGIPRYSNTFNDDYRNTDDGKMPTFNLDKGSVLAIFPQWSDNVNLRFNNTPDLKAFIQVVKANTDQKEMTIELEDDIINIVMPEDMYLTFLDYNKEDYRGIFYSSIIYNALVKGILNINSHEGTSWADSIKAIMESTPARYTGLSLDEPTDAVDIATIMMSHPQYGTPYDLLFTSIKKLQE